MRIALTAFLLLLLSSFSLAQVPGTKWQKYIYNATVANSWHQLIYDAKPTRDNGFIVVGVDSTGVTKAAAFDKSNRGRAWIEKLDSSGNKVWSRVRATDVYQPYNGAMISVQQTADQGYIVVGYAGQAVLGGDPTNPDAQLYIAKYSSDGTFQWEKKYGGDEDDRGMSVQEVNGNGFIVAGIITGAGNYPDLDDALLLRFDASGNVLWAKTYGGSNTDSAYAIIPTPDKGFLIAGSSASNDRNLTGNNGLSDGWAFRVDSLGNLLWQKNYGGTAEDGFKSVTLNNDATYTFVGYSSSPTVLGNTNSGKRDLWVVKTDLNGQVIWSKLFGGSQDEQAFSVQPTPDGNNLISGYTESNDGIVSGNHGGSDAWQLKIDKSGNLIWQKCVGTSTDDGAFAGGAYTERDFYIAGFGKPVASTAFEGYVAALGNANTIKGTLFKDDNLNGIKDGSESFISLPSLINVQKQNSYQVSTSAVNGQFAVDVDTGNYVTMPHVSSPYYNIVPASINSSFSSYFNTDSISFAVQPIPNKQDLVITMFPVTIAKPGYPTKIQVIYKNVGTTTTSGQILLKKDSRVSYTSSIPIFSAGVGDTLKWNYTNLVPGTSASIVVNFDVAAPPAVNNHDTLKYMAIITPVTGDETPSNDTITTKQLVVNSLDPNDKTENNAGVISSSFIADGDYLVYTVRFQNTGTTDATNVIVRDTLGNRVDVNTLEMLASSHPYAFTLVNSNQLVWTFSNINLPDSTANEPASHGYIVYRIRPMNDVVVGETIHNTASIYFDYNLPVLTNDALTLVQDNFSPLPIQLISFTGQLNKNIVQLNWQTAHETDFKNFEVERSIDGAVFTKIESVAFNNSVHDYKATDNVAALQASRIFYRLKLVDKDGRFSYSKVIAFYVSSQNRFIVYPNPARTEMFISMNADKTSNIQIKIIDVSGRIVGEQQRTIEKGSNVFPVNTSKLKNGNYILEVINDGEKRANKFTIVN